jgi:hypothetical protein
MLSETETATWSACDRRIPDVKTGLGIRQERLLAYLVADVWRGLVEPGSAGMSRQSVRLCMEATEHASVHTAELPDLGFPSLAAAWQSADAWERTEMQEL